MSGTIVITGYIHEKNVSGSSGWEIRSKRRKINKLHSTLEGDKVGERNKAGVPRL